MLPDSWLLMLLKPTGQNHPFSVGSYIMYRMEHSRLKKFVLNSPTGDSHSLALVLEIKPRTSKYSRQEL